MSGSATLHKTVMRSTMSPRPARASVAGRPGCDRAASMQTGAERKAMRSVLLFVALTLFPVGLAAPAGAADVVARVGGTSISVDEVRAYLGTLPPAERAALGKDPALLSQAVRSYLVRRLVLKEARERKFDQRPETRERLERAHDAALAELYLQSLAEAPEGFPSEAELEAAYEANKAAFLVARQYRLAQIFIAAAKGDKEAEAKGQARLAEVAKKLKARGADFAALAREHSDTKGEAENGGEIGWLPEPQIVPEIRQAVAGLAKDGLAEPIRLDDGWHIVKLLDTKPAGSRPLAEVRDGLAEQLRQKRAQAVRQAHLNRLLQENPTAINELALSTLIVGGAAK